MRGSSDVVFDEKPMALVKTKKKKKTNAKTKSAMTKYLPSNKSIVDTPTASMNNLSVSNTSTAATANVTVPSVVANVNPPNNMKPNKIATKITLPTCCNPKYKKDIDEGTDDDLFLDPLAVADYVPTYVCNWAQAIKCDFLQLAPLECQHTDCGFLVHHLCQPAWEQREGHPDTVARYCCLHHPQYKYQHVMDRSGVSKKSSSSNSGPELSVDTNATIAEHHNNGIESVHDGNNKLLRDASSSATLSTKEMSVSHLNESQQNIVVDGKLYQCNKVKVKGEKNNIVYVKYLQCGMALDKADGSKWKPYSKVKAALPSEYLRCYGTLRAEFSKVCNKETSHYYPTSKAHICYNATALF